MSLVPAQPIDDVTCTAEACALITRKLGGNAEVEHSMEMFCNILCGPPYYVYCIDVLRAKGFTALQIDTMLADCGMEGGRSTVEFAWGIKFTNPGAPIQGKMSDTTHQKPAALRPARFLEEGEKTLGEYLESLNLLDQVVLSPLLPTIILNPKNVSRPTFYTAIRECLRWTVKTYSMSNLDMTYCTRVEELWGGKYSVPADCSVSKSLKGLTNNMNKTGAKVRRNIYLKPCLSPCPAHTLHCPAHIRAFRCITWMAGPGYAPSSRPVAQGSHFDPG